MDRFEFFFSFHLGERLYSYTDNLSKSLQGSKMAAVSGQRLANLTKETLTKMRINQSFDLSMLHDRTENACTVSTSLCPIQSLRKLF